MAIRILVVDDSVVIRKLLTATLEEVPGLEVVATAALGRIALAKIPQCQPDVVILDVEMPEMDGIETLRQIRKLAPRLPVIMFSTKTERGAAATIEALTSGASDYVAKPSNVGNVALAMQRVREDMVPKIHALTAPPRRTITVPPALRGTPSPGAPSPGAPITAPTPTITGLTQAVPTVTTQAMPTVAPPQTSPTPTITGAPALSAMQTAPTPTIAGLIAQAQIPTGTTSHTTRMPALVLPRARGNTGPPDPIRLVRVVGPRPAVEIVAIGASTGGPNALALLLAQLPNDFPVPIVIVQHMLATFTRHFAERLAAQCKIQIVEANAGDALIAGRAYIARGDYHMVVERKTGRATLGMNQNEVENFCRPAVDVLFRSVAHAYGPSALAVVLTGMGHDGLLGCGAIREAGGDVIVQDEASSVVWGMPGFVARAGLASQLVALDDLGGEVRRRVALGARIESRA